MTTQRDRPLMGRLLRTCGKTVPETRSTTPDAGRARGGPPFTGGKLATDAARCWRKARDQGASAQQRLHAMLSATNCGMLAPVFDSLMILCEAALGRPVAVGSGAALSGDERLLIGLLDGSRHRPASIRCTEGAASALDCAICSTRIMVKLATA